MAEYVNAPSSFDNDSVSFTAANTTLAKIVADVSTGSGTAGVAGYKSGGQRVTDILVTSSDSAANTIILWQAKQLSLYAQMGTVTVTATSNATVTRTSGSFVADGFKVGGLAMLDGSVSGANNGILCTITAVVANTLTFSGVPSGMNAQTEGAGFRVLKVARRSTTLIPANSGTSITNLSSNVQLIGPYGGMDAANDETGIELGPTGMLLVSMGATVSALPAYVSVAVQTAPR